MDNTQQSNSNDQGQSAQSKQGDQGSSGTNDQASQQSWSKEVAGRVYTDPNVLAADYEKLQTAFTKKTQDKGTQPGSSFDDETDLEQVANLLAPVLAKRFVTTDEVKLQNLLSMNPILQGKEQEIRDLANLSHNKGKAYEDIVSQYNLVPSDKLVRAKTSGDVKGNSVAKEAPKEKSVKDMTPEEYEEWRKKNLTGSSISRR